jgi:tetratricopeptide (TPR) repeat protein
MRPLNIFLLLALFLCAVGLHAQKSVEVRGIITDGSEPMEHVRIQIEGRDLQAFTDADGAYVIEANAGDILRYSHMGMRDYIVRVEESTRFLNLIMTPQYNELEEVVITGNKRKTQQELQLEYPLNKRLIRTAFGILNADEMAANIRFLNEDEINPIGICVLDLLRARFAGVRIVGNCQEGGRVIIRGGIGSLTQPGAAIFDVDGMILTDAPIWLDVSSIHRIAIMGGLAQTVKYGGAAGGGVIVINTKTSSPRWDGKFDLAQVRGNYVEDHVLDNDEVTRNDPVYMQELSASNSFEEARKVYETYSSSYRASPYFYLDCYRYFYQKLGARDFADEILISGIGRWEENPTLLKALAYIYTSQERYEEALKLNKRIMELRPRYGQSYMDLGMAYRDSGNFNRALGVYARYKYLIDAGLLEPSEHFSGILQHEGDNLLRIHGELLGTDPRSVDTDPFVAGTTRVVVDWNDMEAEFELQFVNPDGKYYTWKHTFEENEERILDEKLKGYSVEEHIIDQTFPGNWEVNVRYFGNKSRTPTYMRVMVYENFDTPRQRKTVKVFKLFLKDVNHQLFSIENQITRVLD